METSLMFNVARSSLSSALIIDCDDRYQSRSRYDQCHYQEIEINITQLYDNVWRLLAICATILIVWAFCFHHKVHALLLWLRKTRSKGRVLYLWTPFQIGGDLKVKSSDKYPPGVWVKFWQTKKRIFSAGSLVTTYVSPPWWWFTAPVSPGLHVYKNDKWLKNLWFPASPLCVSQMSKVSSNALLQIIRWHNGDSIHWTKAFKYVNNRKVNPRLMNFCDYICKMRPLNGVI